MRNSRQRAITLPELLITLALLTLLSAYAVPSFAIWVASNKQQTLREKLLHSLQMARTQAVLKNRAMEFCGSADALDCDGNWHKGWILRAAANKEILAVEQLSQVDLPLRWKGARDQLVFRSNGQTPLSNGRFILCDDDGKLLWQLIINRQGRARPATAKENLSEAHRCI
ncbi:GspH/FimT family pseudopilin [Pseudomonas sediminis]|uniref:Type II secretion system protein H n=1 Tax=Pseudomonas sediminis TaxID=1691904 RepID=A0A2G5FVG7_9PSED|nr:GspH/FimT family pseudopilin [Pseudomonas sediminis]PIA71862.1 pilus assembly protein FimT [Pseudomonas sediminis]